MAPEHPWPNSPLGGVVGRLHAGGTHKRLERLALLEDVPTHPCGLGHRTRVARFQQPLHLAPNRPPKCA
jgi:hypothetical protein